MATRYIKKFAAIKTFHNLIKQEFGEGSEVIEQHEFYRAFCANEETIRKDIAAMFAMGRLMDGVKDTQPGEYFGMEDSDWKLILPAINERSAPWPDTNFILQFKDFIQAVRNAPDELPQ